MKKTLTGVLLTVLLLCTACGQKESVPTWQDQYDLGVRYLSDGNYEEAIIAFTAAIEIDPKQPLLYIGRADAYIAKGDTDENLSSALLDYEKAISLDDANSEAWLGLADVYIRYGDYDKAMEVLREALDKTGNAQPIVAKLTEMESGSIVDSSNQVRRSSDYDLNGTLLGYTLYKYDEKGRRCGWENWSCSDSDGEGNTLPLDAPIMENYCVVSYDERDLPVRYQFYNADGASSSHDIFVYNTAGLKVEQHRYSVTGERECYFLFYYNDQGQEIRYEGYNDDGSMYNYWISEYDADGNFIKETQYNPDGSAFRYSIND